MASERLQKVIARAGVASRRGAESLIRQGRVRVNGQTAELGQSADPAQDEIRIDGERLPAAEPTLYIAFHKPPGVLTSNRSQGGKPTIYDLIDLPYRLFPVGRLDFNSQGLLLLTNHGQAAHRLSHPRFQHAKEYLVVVDRPPDRAQLEKWRRGVVLYPEAARTGAVRVDRLGKREDGYALRVVMTQGIKRQIRRTAVTVGLHVRRLVRTHIGALELGDLPPGAWRYLSPAEMKNLGLEVDKRPDKSAGKTTPAERERIPRPRRPAR
jgi:23S rRNA pseudouridine2605 synthase